MTNATNSLNINSSGVVVYNASSGVFAQSVLTQHDVLIGGSTNNLVSVTPSTAGSVLTSNGTSADPSFQVPATTTKVTTFISSGTWTVDPRSKLIEFYVWGGGAGGGSGRCGVSAASSGGSAGAAGGFAFERILFANLTSSSYSITVAGSSTGGASINAIITNGNAGTTGNSSSIGTICIVPGGSAGLGGTATGVSGEAAFSLNLITSFSGEISGNGGLNGVGPSNDQIYAWATGGGSAAGYTISTAHTGGSSGNITDLSGNILVSGGTAGDNLGNPGGNGNSPSNQLIVIGGTGGGGGGISAAGVSGSGGNGGFPGGGGGGGAGALSSTPSGAGGNGAQGQIIIVEFL